MTEREYLISLSTFTLFGPKRVRLLVSYFKSASSVWRATRKDLLNLGIGASLVDKFIEHRSRFDFDDYVSGLKRHSIKVLLIDDPKYPENLKLIDDAPIVLYVRGNLKRSDTRAVAIVGTRSMTAYGREIAKKFAEELTGFGITIISGLAIGVDVEAQRSALKAGGRTISVLASGLDTISPISNKALALEFIKNSGAIVSEYPLGYQPHPYDFPVRDRLISGMAKAVVVIEGRMKSGTFYTVKAAADQGRPVFAIPGPITSPASEGPNYLIQNGAKLVTDVKDILEELNMQFKVDIEAVEKIIPTDRSEAKLVEILEVEPMHLDELVRITGGKTSEVSARLIILEMKGLVKNLGGGIYRKI